MKIPSLILKRLYTFGSIENTRGGVRFLIKNMLRDSTVVGVLRKTVGWAGEVSGKSRRPIGLW